MTRKNSFVLQVRAAKAAGFVPKWGRSRVKSPSKCTKRQQRNKAKEGDKLLRVIAVVGGWLHACQAAVEQERWKK